MEENANFVTENGSYQWTRVSMSSMSTGEEEFVIIFTVSLEVWQLKFLH